MKIHPFKPQVSAFTKKLLIGTLPPEDVKFYFSNSSNTRLWDILNAINEKSECVGNGGNSFRPERKIDILNSLEIGIADVIYGYERDSYNSTKDKHIAPSEYLDILQLAVDNNISELLFLYQSAYKWFIHSLDNDKPVRLKKLKSKYIIGAQPTIRFNGVALKCVLLPSPLNRGRKGETLVFKLAFYQKYILTDCF